MECLGFSVSSFFSVSQSFVMQHVATGREFPLRSWSFYGEEFIFLFRFLPVFTARKRSLGQGNMFTGVCLSTGVGGGCVVRGSYFHVFCTVLKTSELVEFHNLNYSSFSSEYLTLVGKEWICPDGQAEILHIAHTIFACWFSSMQIRQHSQVRLRGEVKHCLKQSSFHVIHEAGNVGIFVYDF